MSRYSLTRFENPAALAECVADQWVDFVCSRGSAEPVSVALSGGRIASNLFTAIVGTCRRRSEALAPVQFFWADERCVPPDNPESNYAAANELLFKPLDISAQQVHRIKGELIPDRAAMEAADTLQAVVATGAGGLPRISLVLLGMGEDGHVASLFPGGVACTGSQEIYCHVRGPKPPPNRITISFAMIAAACQVWVLVSGAGKQSALHQSLSGASTPLGKVLASREHTRIYSDVE